MVRFKRKGTEYQRTQNPPRKFDAWHQLPLLFYRSILMAFPVEVQGVAPQAERHPDTWLPRLVIRTS